MGQIRFDLREIPHAETEERLGYYPVVANPRTMTARQLCESISHRCTANTADVAAVMTAMAQVMAEKLREGVRVEVPELGSFAPTLACEYRITHPADLQIARHLQIDGISFTPKRSLTGELADVVFHRVEDAGQTAAALSTEELKQRVRAYLTTEGHAVLDRAAMERITACRKTKAVALLNELTKEGFLKKSGKRNSPFYTLAD